MLLKQPGQGNVVTQFLPKKWKLKLKDGERQPGSEMFDFLCGFMSARDAMHWTIVWYKRGL